jgi:uncharacterized damage-inducible protein DinB
MTTLADDLTRLFVRDLEALGRELELFPADAGVWQTVPGTTNSAGTLALHVCGGLRHFVGAVLGQTGYVRDRDAEFSQRGLPRAALLAEIGRTADVIRQVVPGLPPEVLEAPYPMPINGITLSTRRFLIHLATHAAFHLGQAGYLRRALTGEAAISGAVAIGALKD